MFWWKLLNSLYLILSCALMVYALNGFILLLLHRRKYIKTESPLDKSNLPIITIQLPVFNESLVVERLVQSICELDYPRSKLQIQVLDDSTDHTTEILKDIISRKGEDGFDIQLIHRVNRDGFKAGALQAAMGSARGEFIAIFDADFVPPEDFLQAVIPHFHAENLGCIQTRWTHLNHDYSLLTRAQALSLDTHFSIEQVARSRNGLLMNFNGSAGIWRKTCIEDSGGWQADTLTEDFDLSCRAQFKGWRIDYLPHIGVPAEIPPHMKDYHRQQARWARGSMQTLRKLLIPLLRANLPLHVKLEGILHLSHYLVHPLMLMLILLIIPMQLNPIARYHWLPFFSFAAILPVLLFIFADTPQLPGFWNRLKTIPVLIFLGIGLSLNNAIAVFKGLFFKNHGIFSRTPKYAIQRGENIRKEKTIVSINFNAWGNLILALYCLSGFLSAGIAQPLWRSIWLVIFTISYLSVFIAGLSDIPEPISSKLDN